MDLLTLLLALGASFLAVVSQLLTGFGFALVLIPLLMLRTTPAEAVVISAMIGTMLTTILVVRDRDHIDRHTASRLALWSIAGLPAGIFVLNAMPPIALKWTIIVVVAVALLIVAADVSLRQSRIKTALVGLLSGTLFTSTGVNGPPLVALMRAHTYSVQQYRATLAAVFSVQGWAGVIMLGSAGQISIKSLSAAGVGIVAMPLGFYIGNKLFKHIDARRLKAGITLMLLLCMAFVIAR